MYKIAIQDFGGLKGTYNFVGADNEFVYVKSDTKLSKPFVECELPQSIIDSIDSARENKKTELENARMQANYKSVEYNGKKIQATAMDQTLISNAVLMLSQVGGTMQWITEDNSIIEANLQDMTAIMGLIVKQVSDNFLKCRQLKDKLLLCETIDEINEIKFDEGDNNVQS